MDDADPYWKTVLIRSIIEFGDRLDGQSVMGWTVTQIYLKAPAGRKCRSCTQTKHCCSLKTAVLQGELMKFEYRL